MCPCQMSTDNDVFWCSDVEGQYLEPIYLIYVCFSEVILTTMMSRISYDILFCLHGSWSVLFTFFAENPASHVAVILLW